MLLIKGFDFALRNNNTEKKERGAETKGKCIGKLYPQRTENRYASL